jgi:hypothetical protein
MHVADAWNRLLPLKAASVRIKSSDSRRHTRFKKTLNDEVVYYR